MTDTTTILIRGLNGIYKPVGAKFKKMVEYPNQTYEEYKQGMPLGDFDVIKVMLVVDYE